MIGRRKLIGSASGWISRNSRSMSTTSSLAFTHANDTAAADLETKSLKHMDIPDTLVKGMCTADILIKGTAAVQVMVDPVKTSLLSILPGAL